MFKANILLLGEQQIDAESNAALMEVIEQHANHAAKELAIDWPVNFTVYPNPSFTLKETGDGGYTPTKDWVQLSIDLSGTNIPPSQVIQNLAPTIYHEMNHCKRWSTVGYGTTLEESIVTEGLASVFEEAMWNKSRAPWLIYTEMELEQFLDIVRKRNTNAPYIHSDWFYGSNPDIPRWLGYKTGHAIVKKALENNPDLSILDLMELSGTEVLSKSGINL